MSSADYRIRLALRLLGLTILLAAPADLAGKDEPYRFARDGFFAASPGPARGKIHDGLATLENDILEARWRIEAGVLKFAAFRSRLAGQEKAVLRGPGEVFILKTRDRGLIRASDCRVEVGPIHVPITADALSAERGSGRYEDGLPRHAIRALFVHEASGLTVSWRAELRDGSNHVRTEALLVGKDPVIDEVILVDAAAGSAGTLGRVAGSPVFAGTLFAGVEHPLAANRFEEGRVRCGLARPLRLPARSREDRESSARKSERPSGDEDRAASDPVAETASETASGGESRITAAMGVTAPGQRRRGFLYYLERCRIHPYRPFLHYNSWYDIAWPGHLMNETLCRNVIDAFEAKLVKPHGVTVDAFVFDDGWDDHETLWAFHDGFPEGFAPLAKRAADLGAGIGTWVSPWGGYGAAKAARVKYGKARGFETNAGGLSLAGARYGRRFREVCERFMDDYGMNYFKFDGIGGGTYATGAPPDRAGDLEALLALCRGLHEKRPDLFINATVGTWPSPWWLFSVDSIWRQGEDISFYGEAGTIRDRWITYRDGMAHRRIRRAGPCFPLNSLMVHGLALAKLGTPTRMNNDPTAYIRDVRNFFATGTGLQELYVTPSLLTDAQWHFLAEAARWARDRAPVLVDSHWHGGDPYRGEVYGFAAFSPDLAVVAARNPTERKAVFELALDAVLELPDGAPSTWILTRALESGSKRPPLEAVAGDLSRIELEPLEMAVWDARPVRESAPYIYGGYEDLPLARDAGPGPATSRFLGFWTYRWQGKRYCREFREDGTAHLYVEGKPYGGWAGFTWKWDDGMLLVLRPDGTVDGEHVLEDDDTLEFLLAPFGPATRTNGP